MATPQRSTGSLGAYNGTGTNFRTSSLASNLPFTTQGFKQDQYNASGDVNIFLKSTSYLTVRGGYFHDNYQDTGISTITSYTYQQPAFAAGIPPALQGPTGTINTPRTIITNFDTVKRGFINADYNQLFTAAGSHQFKAGVGFQRSTNDVDVSYPGGYTYVYWNTPGTANASGSRDNHVACHEVGSDLVGGAAAAVRALGLRFAAVELVTDDPGSRLAPPGRLFYLARDVYVARDAPLVAAPKCRRIVRLFVHVAGMAVNQKEGMVA